MSNSLLKTIHGHKVEVGEANAYHSQRWSDLEHNLCTKRDMYDTAGRGPLCADSLYAGSNGCVPAIQRINAENENRPKYGEYIPRVGAALSGDLYESITESNITGRQRQLYKNSGYGNVNYAIKYMKNHDER